MGGRVTGLSARHTRDVAPFSLRSRKGGRGVGWEGWDRGVIIKLSYIGSDCDRPHRIQQLNMTNDSRKRYKQAHFTIHIPYK